MILLFAFCLLWLLLSQQIITKVDSCLSSDLFRTWADSAVRPSSKHQRNCSKHIIPPLHGLRGCIRKQFAHHQRWRRVFGFYYVPVPGEMVACVDIRRRISFFHLARWLLPPRLHLQRLPSRDARETRLAHRAIPTDVRVLSRILSRGRFLRLDAQLATARFRIRFHSFICLHSACSRCRPSSSHSLLRARSVHGQPWHRRCIQCPHVLYRSGPLVVVLWKQQFWPVGCR